MKDFDTFTKIAKKCGRFGLNNCCHRLQKVAQSAINRPIRPHGQVGTRERKNEIRKVGGSTLEQFFVQFFASSFFVCQLVRLSLKEEEEGSKKIGGNGGRG